MITTSQPKQHVLSLHREVNVADFKAALINIYECSMSTHKNPI